jgi:hypothetical protein
MMRPISSALSEELLEPLPPPPEYGVVCAGTATVVGARIAAMTTASMPAARIVRSRRRV